MSDARHPRKYPRGQRLPINDEWRAAVRTQLELNQKAGRSPKNEAELARIIGADKGGLHTALHGTQVSYRYARQISDVLRIGDAMVPNASLGTPVDELDAAVRRIRELTPERQRQALAILRTFDVDDDR